jgi:hypothetical protein
MGHKCIEVWSIGPVGRFLLLARLETIRARAAQSRELLRGLSTCDDLHKHNGIEHGRRRFPVSSQSHAL